MMELIKEARMWVDVWLVQVEQVANGKAESASGCTAKLFDEVSAVALFAVIWDDTQAQKAAER